MSLSVSCVVGSVSICVNVCVCVRLRDGTFNAAMCVCVSRNDVFLCAYRERTVVFGSKNLCFVEVNNS